MKSQGLGDTIEKITTATGIKKVVKKVSKGCGCEERRNKLNNPDLLVNKVFYKNRTK